MSTKERYGTAVWTALVELTAEEIVGHVTYATATMVGGRAGVSSMTARKYLTIMAEAGTIEVFTMMGITGYRVNFGTEGLS